MLLKTTPNCRRASASRAAARSTKTRHNRAIVLTCSPRDRVAIAELCDCSGPLTWRFPSDRRGHGPSAFALLHRAITAFARPANTLLVRCASKAKTRLALLVGTNPEVGDEFALMWRHKKVPVRKR